MAKILLEEYDDTRWGILRPEHTVAKPCGEFPDTVVCEFSRETIREVAAKYNGKPVGRLASVGGDTVIYEILYGGVKLALCQVMIGAPACVSNMEELIALGAKQIFVCGECGVLDGSIEDAHLIIPTAALRDEGTSYHYLPAADEIELDPCGIEIIEEVFREHDLAYTKGKIWTTDAPYRETRKKMENRRGRGCIAVDMECAALASAAKLREIKFSQFVYACDNLDAEEWEQRGLTVRPISQKAQIFELAMECAVRMKKR